MGYQRRVHGREVKRKMKVYFVLLVKSHLQSYPCPLQINFFWNLGFLLGVAIMLQIITGIFLGLHYTSDLNSAYYQIFFFLSLGIFFWTNEFLGSYSNYKFIISFSIFNRMGLWRTLCLLSNIEEVLSLSFYLPISPLWFSFSSSFLSSFSIF